MQKYIAFIMINYPKKKRICAELRCGTRARAQQKSFFKLFYDLKEPKCKEWNKLCVSQLVHYH